MRCTSHSSGSRQPAVDPHLSCAHAKKRGLSMLCIANVKRFATRESSGRSAGCTMPPSRCAGASAGASSSPAAARPTTPAATRTLLGPPFAGARCLFSMSFFFPADPATQRGRTRRERAKRHHVKLEFGNIIFKQFNNCVILPRRLNTSAADGTHTAAYSPHAHDIVRKDIPQVQLQGVRSRCCSAARAPQRSASTGGRHPPHRRITPSRATA